MNEWSGTVMDMAVEVMVAVVHIGMIMVVVVTLVLQEWNVMMVAKGMKWLAKVTLQVEIVVPNMVIIDFLVHRHCLLVLFMDLSKR
jgi:hypothetical protein